MQDTGDIHGLARHCVEHKIVLDVKSQSTRTIAQGQDFFFGDLVWLR